MSDTATPTSQKITAQDLSTQIAAVQAFQGLFLNPEPIKVHKPSKSGSGSALKLDLRLTPDYGQGKDGRVFVRDVKGGLFLEIAPQLGRDEGGNATFDWQNTIMAKLGLPDITALLVAYRCRWAGRGLPANILRKDQNPAVVSLFHKFNDDSTVIEIELHKEGSKVSISKKTAGQVHKGFIPLLLTEELLVERYLDEALTAFLKVGKR
jgi:hypothetical protein